MDCTNCLSWNTLLPSLREIRSSESTQVKQFRAQQKLSSDCNNSCPIQLIPKLADSDFHSIGLQDLTHLERFFRGQNSARQTICQYTLNTFYSWNQGSYEYQYAIAKNVLFIKSVNLETDTENLFMPISLHTPLPPEQIAVILKNCQFGRLLMVSEQQLAQFDRKRWTKHFQITEESAWADYVYPSSQLAQLEGRKLHKKRNLLRQFERETNAQNVVLHNLTESHQETVIEVLERWQATQTPERQSDPELSREREAIIRSVSSLTALSLRGWLLEVDGQARAFAIASELNPETLVIHFEKTDYSIKGLGQAINQKVAAAVVDDYPLINRESDLDDPGLRRAKTSYLPSHLEKCYNLIPLNKTT